MAKVFTATFSAVAVSAAQDVFEIVAGTDYRVQILECRLGQYTDFGDAAAELVSIRVIRGNTTTGSGGTAPTPRPTSAWGSEMAFSTVAANNTTPASNGTEEVLLADSFNVAAGFLYAPDDVDDGAFTLRPGQRLCFRITAPADALTMNGTLTFKELPRLA
jgi:hypothetical protein